MMNTQAFEFTKMSGLRMIKTHLAQRGLVENYVNGSSKLRPHVPTECQVNCELNQCLHNSPRPLNLERVDAICKNCEAFQESANYVSALVDMGLADLAQKGIQSGLLFESSSSKFQENLEKLGGVRLVAEVMSDNGGEK